MQETYMKRSALSAISCIALAMSSSVECGAQNPLLPERKAQSKLVCQGQDDDVRCSWQAVPTPVVVAVPNRIAKDGFPFVSHVPIASPAATEVTIAKPSVEILIEIELNGKRSEQPVQALRNQNKFFVSQDTLRILRIRERGLSEVNHSGETFYELSGSGISYTFDEGEQFLKVSAPAAAFDRSEIDLATKSSQQPDRSGTGIFFNHDFQLSRANEKYALAGLIEFGLFSPAGILTSRFANSNVFSGKPVRLDTQFMRDFPSKMMTLLIGDAISQGSSWSRALPYGGIRWASKFSTQPGFIPFPLPSLNGEAAQPSTVDLFVNGIRAGRSNVDPGPFTIRNIPIMTGQGNVQIVVTDVLGRQRVITQSYMADPQILRHGVTSYALETGFLRNNYGRSSAEYGAWFTSGSYKRGITDNLTIDLGSQLSKTVQTTGAGSSFAIPTLGSMNISGVVSHSSAGVGALVRAQMQHRGRQMSVGAAISFASRSFNTLGVSFDRERLVAQLQFSRSLRKGLSISSGYLYRSIYPSSSAKSKFSAANITLNAQLTRSIFLLASVNYAPTDRQANSVALSLMIPLGGGRTVIAASDVRENGYLSQVEMNKPLPVGSGLGYRVRTSTNHLGDRVLESSLSYQNPFGAYTFESALKGSQASWRLTETGSLILLDKQLFLSRWVTDSFAAIKVDGGAGLKVFANNHFVARTNRRGMALIPNLVPYEANSVRVDDEGLPVESNVDLSEKRVTPMPRSGVSLKVASSRVTGAVLRLTKENGEPLPLGAEAMVLGQAEPLFVGYRGDLYVAQPSCPLTIEVRWPGGFCRAVVEELPKNQLMPHVVVPCRATP
jgi:outer membrane usher protein